MKLLQGFEAARAAVLSSNSSRAFSASPEIESRVRAIVESVRQHGDAALLANVQQFDCPQLTLGQLRVTAAEIDEAWESTSERVRQALTRAASNIEAFHRRQQTGDWFTTTPEGAFLGQRYTPIERVGLYAPNGRASYPSTVLMLAIPARVAGVKDLVLATPAGPDGKAHPAILAAAKIAGITEIYRIGGAAAVAAFAYGSETVPRVDKIVGPGSIYFTLAKKHVYGTVGIDGLYGPSEVVVLADSGANPAQLAADLLAQAEHGADSFVCFVGTSSALCQAVLRELEAQAAASPRAALALGTLQDSLACAVDTMEEACAISDLVAAEHVEIWSPEALHWSRQIHNAGAIFLNTPVPLGDYIAGPSHTLPTGATARFASGVGVDTFLKRTSLLAAPQVAIAELAEDLEIIAELEELPGHAAAVRRAAK